MTPSRVLLISPNRCTTPDPVFPLGLAHLSGALRSTGYETRWWDCQLPGPPLESLLHEFQPQFIGISIRNIDDILNGRRETYFPDAISVCQTVRRVTSVPLILGGSGFSVFPRPLLELTGADYGICGEGETGLVTLLQTLERGAVDRTIPGLVYRSGGQLQQNPAGFSAPPLELGDWPEDVAHHYLKSSGMLNVQTQRGCALHCCYCTYPVIEGRQHRSRSPEVVALELERLTQLGAKYAFIVDSVFNSSRVHVEAICHAILRRGVKIQWSCFLRPSGLTAEEMGLMKEAGLSHIEFGSDSLCDSVLNEYGKRFTFDDILRSSELAAQAGVEFCHFLIGGGPGETLETLEESYRNSQRLPGGTILAVVGIRIYPGTPLFDRARREGRVTSESELLTPRFYLATGLSSEKVTGTLREFGRRSTKWIAGEASPAYETLAKRLRAKGVTGPIWAYFSTLQRLWPETPSRPVTAR